MTDEELTQLAENAKRQGTTDEGMPSAAAPNEYVPYTPSITAPVVGEPGPSAPLPQIAPDGPRLADGTLDAIAGVNAPLRPGTGSGPAIGPVTPKNPNVDTGAADQALAARNAEADAKGAEGPLSADKAEKDAEVQDRIAAQKRTDAIDMQAEIQAQNDGQERARRIADQAEADYAGFKTRDFYNDAPTHTKLLRALAVGLGGMQVGSRENGNTGQNEALDVLTKRADSFNKQQQQELATKENFEKYKREGVRDLQARYKDDLAKLQLRQAKGLEALGDEAQAQLIRNGVPLEQAKNDTIVRGLRAKGAEDYAKTYEGMVKLGTLESLAKGKKKGGGGGASGDALAAFAEAAGALAPGDPITADVVRAGIKAGLKPNQIAGEADKYRGSGSKSKNAALGETRIEDKEADKWAKSAGLEAIQKQQRELSALQKELGDNPHNPQLQAAALEKAVSAARGGAASKQALALALGHLGGSLDNAEAFIQKIRTGELGQKQMQNFTQFIAGQRSASQAEGKTAYDNYNKWVATQPADKQPGLLRGRSRIFSGLDGFGGKEGGAPSPAVPRHSAAQIAEAQAWVDANPDAPQSAGVRAKIEAWKAGQ